MDPSMSYSAFDRANGQLQEKPLDFFKSMNHFRTMFPTIEADVIETVLRSNNGVVEATIDQLLQISGESSNNLPNHPPSYSALMQTTGPYNLSKNLTSNSTPEEKVQKSTLKQMDLLGNQASQKQLIDFDTVTAQEASASAVRGSSSRFEPPLVGSLPNDFLRITTTSDNNIGNQQTGLSYNAACNTVAQTGVPVVSHSNLIRQSSQLSAVASSTDHQLNHHLLRKKMEENERQRLNSNIDDKEIAQYLEDERIALMIQNQEFVDELRRNKEFMSALHYDAMNHNTRVKGFHNENYTGSTGTSTSGGVDGNGANFSDADFKERIRKMGEMSRKKFAQMAGLFTRRKGSGLPSRDNLLLGDQYAQLENDCSDSEEYGQKKDTNK